MEVTFYVIYAILLLVKSIGVLVMLLGETFRSTGPPPPGLVPVAGGTITVAEPTRAATPPVKPPLIASARESDALPIISRETYKPQTPTPVNTNKPKPPPPPAGGTSAFAAHVIASQDTTVAVEQPLPAKSVKQAPLKQVVSLEPLAQRTQQQLSGEELKIVQRLAARDREVKAHERAHIAAAAGIAGAPSFSYVTGPDAQRYAVSGEVRIDTSGDPASPEATITKMEQVKKAALAPSQPSAQDKAVALVAEAKIREAQAEIRTIKREEEEQKAIESAAKKEALAAGLPVVHANIQQANTAFANSAAIKAATPISLEPLFA